MKIKNLFYLQVNLLFVLVFANIWDFVLNRSFFNGMVIGFLMFGPTSFFWVVGNIRAVVLLTLLSVFEFMVMVVFVAEGFELGGVETTRKALFWVPYLIVAGLNCYWGLNIYSKRKGRVK